ncbi:MAG TPA: hypothetical protein VFF83_02255 [Clostridia bacterium]|nr:hypothetical protein [Clostridia bacterium]
MKSGIGVFLVLIIHRESTKDAIKKGIKIYRCKATELKIHTIKKPRYALKAR